MECNMFLPFVGLQVEKHIAVHYALSKSDRTRNSSHRLKILASRRVALLFAKINCKDHKISTRSRLDYINGVIGN